MLSRLSEAARDIAGDFLAAVGTSIHLLGFFLPRRVGGGGDVLRIGLVDHPRHGVGLGLDHRHGHLLPELVEDLGHAQLLPDDTDHDASMPRSRGPVAASVRVHR